ncbi:MAG: molybdate ABC transporter substrate-binding protein [Pseudomonadota bacterium]
MKMRRMLFTVILVVCSLATIPVYAGDVSLSAAASTKDAMNAIIEGFKKVHPDVNVLTNYGASGALAKQTVQGAPTDIFLSANDKWLDYVVKEGKAEVKDKTFFAYNKLVFAGKKDLAVKSLADLKSLQRVAIGTPASVPAGQYAEQAMRGAGIYEELEKDKKLVMAQDVRQALLYADRGEVDGAFVYQTDALLAKEAVILMDVPENLYDRVSYPMVITTTGLAKAEAKEFYNYLAGPEAQEILKKFGFVTAK